ncbi:MAG: Fe-S cluster assembly protein SufD [Muribaculum sp.]|nr:Fe-S cluster assembly protein SufD [Muribaculum sp.]
MSSITQYIDIYREYAEAIDKNSVPGLNRLRPMAFKALEGRKMPARGDEGYEKTSLEEMFAPDFGLNIFRLNIPVEIADTFKCDIPRVSTLTAYVVNDKFVQGSATADRLPDGVVFGSLAEVASARPELIEKYYGKLATLESVPTALNTLLVQDGVVLYIPRGVKLDRPLQLVNIFSSPTPLMAMRRLLIVLEDDAKAQLLVCDHTQDGDRQYLSSQVIEIFAGRNASFDFYDIEESSALTSRCSQLYARQDEGSNLAVNGTTLACGTTRNDYEISLEGAHASSFLGGMAIASGHQHVDNDSCVNHRSPDCQSRQLFKYILDDEATGAFEGGITVFPGAERTQAYQSNKNVLASGVAKMHTKPQLLIYCDDVKCSHGATTGQLDQNALFYMRQRGIPDKMARTMLMQAFMADVIDTVNIEGLADRLRHLVEKRLHGQASFCSDCALSK